MGKQKYGVGNVELQMYSGKLDESEVVKYYNYVAHIRRLMEREHKKDGRDYVVKVKHKKVDWGNIEGRKYIAIFTYITVEKIKPRQE